MILSYDVVYDRTSGDEDDGQDPTAQLNQTIHRAREAGFNVTPTLAFTDPDIPGDTPWIDREGLEAARDALEPDSTLIVREISRLWRGPISEGYRNLSELRNLHVLNDPIWNRKNGEYLDTTETAELMRPVQLWASWMEKRRAIQRSGHAMTEIAAGRRPTKSGLPPHRPPRILDPKGLEAARAALNEGASQVNAREAYRRATGYYAVTDPEARRRRDISRTVLMERLRPAGNPNLSESQSDTPNRPPANMGPLPDTPTEASR